MNFSPGSSQNLLPKTIVLIGLMGAGKTSIGARLAKKLSAAFVDSDHMIEEKLGYPISYIFEYKGEAYFRDCEREIILEMLTTRSPHILATGGGAFMDPETRKAIKKYATSIWLKADLETLIERVSRRNNRPLLANKDKRAVLQELIEIRYPIYAEADLTIESSNQSHHTVTQVILKELTSLYPDFTTLISTNYDS